MRSLPGKKKWKRMSGLRIFESEKRMYVCMCVFACERVMEMGDERQGDDERESRRREFEGKETEVFIFWNDLLGDNSVYIHEKQ